MAQQDLGPHIKGRLREFARAAIERGLEPVSYHLGAYQWQQLRDHAVQAHERKHGERFVTVNQMMLDGLPVWRHPDDHHIEIEIIGQIDVGFLEACLVK
jgi:hypothetical protein